MIQRQLTLRGAQVLRLRKAHGLMSPLKKEINMMVSKSLVLVLSLVSATTTFAAQDEICGLVQDVQYSKGRLLTVVRTTNNNTIKFVSNGSDRGPATSILTTALLANKTTCFASDMIVNESSPQPIGFDSVRIGR